MADGYINDHTSGSQLLSYKILSAVKRFWDTSAEPWAIKDKDSRYVYANAAYLDFLQLPDRSKLIGKLDRDLTCDHFEKPFQLDGQQLLYSNSIDRTSFICLLKYSISGVCQGMIFDRFPLVDEEKNIMGVAFHGKNPLRLTGSDLFKKSPLPHLNFGYPDCLFTEFEWDIVFLLLESKSRKEIALKLNRSLCTINNKIQTIYEKSGVSSYDALTKYCKENNYDNFIPPRFIF